MTKFIFGFLACSVSVMITQIVHICFVGTALFLLFGMTLRNILVEAPLTRVIFKNLTSVGQREQAADVL